MHQERGFLEAGSKILSAARDTCPMAVMKLQAAVWIVARVELQRRAFLREVQNK